MNRAIRITCRKNDHGTRPDTFFANVWSMDGRCAQLGHGEGKTRDEAIAQAKRNVAERAARAT